MKMPLEREHLAVIGLAVAMGVVLLIATTATQSRPNDPPSPEQSRADLCARCTDVTRAHSSTMWTPRDNAAGCSLNVDVDSDTESDPVVRTACAYSVQPPQAWDASPRIEQLTTQDATNALAEHQEHMANYHVSLPRCANHATDDSQVTCCMINENDFLTTCPSHCFPDGGQTGPLTFARMTKRMKAGPAGCFQRLDEETGLIV
jgi:hypothetical protein